VRSSKIVRKDCVSSSPRGPIKPQTKPNFNPVPSPVVSLQKEDAERGVLRRSLSEGQDMGLRLFNTNKIPLPKNGVKDSGFHPVVTGNRDNIKYLNNVDFDPVNKWSRGETYKTQ